MDRRFWLLRGLKFALLGALLITAVGFVTMSLWNWLVPVLFHGPIISFGQALGLFVLSKLLLGGFRGGGGRHNWNAKREAWRRKMESRLSTMTDEQRARFQDRFGRCAGQHFSRHFGENVSAEKPSA